MRFVYLSTRKDQRECCETFGLFHIDSSTVCIPDSLRGLGDHGIDLKGELTKELDEYGLAPMTKLILSSAAA